MSLRYKILFLVLVLVAIIITVGLVYRAYTTDLLLAGLV